MQFSSVTPLIDAYMLGQISGKPSKELQYSFISSAKILLYLRIAIQIQLTASEDDLQTYFQSYDKIS